AARARRADPRPVEWPVEWSGRPATRPSPSAAALAAVFHPRHACRPMQVRTAGGAAPPAGPVGASPYHGRPFPAWPARMTTLIDIHRHGAIVELRLARPPVNALDPALCAALTAAVGAAVEGGAHGIVLSGGEKVFSAGLDVPYLLGLETRDGVGAAWTCFLDAARALAASPVPVAAAITGHSPAGGCVLALCCDYRVMADGPFRIGLNETQVGLVAPDGIQHLMRRVVGTHRAE